MGKFLMIGCVMLLAAGTVHAETTAKETPTTLQAQDAREQHSFLVMDLKEELLSALKEQGVEGEVSIEHAMAARKGAQSVSIDRMDKLNITAPIYIDSIQVSE